jgi:hypothetical protein
MSQNITRIRGSNKRIDPIPSLFLGLLQADFFFSLFYFVFCHGLIKYARSGIYIALKGKHHHSHVLKVADNAPDFLTIYGSFVTVTGILWLVHTIYLRTSIPKDRQLRRIQGTHSPLHERM